MFHIIGIGLRPEHLTIEALEVLEGCKAVFLEGYTSAYAEATLKQLSERIGKKIMRLNRACIEERSSELLIQGKRENVALLVFGNPLTATTHIQLLLDAKKLGVKCRVIAGISVMNFLGATGLDEYRFGRVATVVFPEPNYVPESFYDIIEKNHSMGLHTLCLLDIRAWEGRMMSVGEALKILDAIEKKRGKSILHETVLVAMCGAGTELQLVRAGSFNELARSGFTVFPQSLIVCAKLNDKEQEAMRELL